MPKHPDSDACRFLTGSPTLFHSLCNLALLALLWVCCPLQGAPPELATQGNQIIVKSTGESVRLTGVNIPSLEWGYGESLLTSLSEAVTNWNANIIRLPVKDTTYLSSSTYRDIVSSFISQASALRASLALAIFS
mgnify:FL=1